MEQAIWICSRQPQTGCNCGRHILLVYIVALCFVIFKREVLLKFIFTHKYILAVNSKKSLEKKEVLEEIVEIGSSSKVSINEFLYRFR